MTVGPGGQFPQIVGAGARGVLPRADRALVDEVLVEIDALGAVPRLVQATLLVAGSIRSLPVAWVVTSETISTDIEGGGVERIGLSPILSLKARVSAISSSQVLGKPSPGLLVGGLVEHEDAARGRDGRPLRMPFIDPEFELGFGPVGKVDDVGIVPEIGEAGAVLGEQRQPRPVDLHDVGFGAAGQLRGQLFKMAGKAGELRRDGVAVFLAADLERFLRGGMAGIAAPPRHARSAADALTPVLKTMVRAVRMLAVLFIFFLPLIG